MPWSDDPLIEELIARRRLPPSDPRYISNEMLNAFLRGRWSQFVRQGSENVATITVKSRVIDVAPFVEKMMQSEIYKIADNGKGVKASSYQKLWPRIVTQPLAYQGRFDNILLVDRSIDLSKFIQLKKIVIFSDPEKCFDLVMPPVSKDGVSAIRYIAFIQFGKKKSNKVVDDRRGIFDADETGLVKIEGLHLVIQYENYLRKNVVELVGSSGGEGKVPFVGWFSFPRPIFGVDNAKKFSGSASRGREVVIV